MGIILLIKLYELAGAVLKCILVWSDVVEFLCNTCRNRDCRYMAAIEKSVQHMYKKL